MDVSVTIVNWNAASSLAACLRSVYATATALRYEVIVVDNGSDDGGVDAVMAEFPQAKWLRNATNIGFGRAQNQAVRVARGRYVLMLNNDAAVEVDTIPTLVALMDERPDAGACGCPDYRQTALGAAYSGAFASFPSLPRTAMENFWAVVRPPRNWDVTPFAAPIQRWMDAELLRSPSRDVAWIVGALLCVRKEVFDQIGGFDERFFLFDEDIDLCRRMRDADWKIVFSTSTRFAHEGGVSSAGRRDIEKIRGDSRALYFRKYHGRATELLFRMQHLVLRRFLLSLRRRLAGLAGQRAGAAIDSGRVEDL